MDNNIGDVTAKATSQTICTSLLGTAAGMALAAAVGQDAAAAGAAYMAVAGAHLWTSKRSVHVVPLATLNASRLQLLLARFMQQQQRSGAETEQQPAELCTPLPTPAQLAAEEPLFSSPTVLVGANLQRLDEEQGRLLAAALPLYGARQHVLLPVPGRPRRVLLLLHEGAEAGDCLLAFLQAWLLLEGGQPVGDSAAARAALQRADALLPALQQELAAAGWEVGKVALEGRRRRVTWQQSPER